MVSHNGRNVFILPSATIDSDDIGSFYQIYQNAIRSEKGRKSFQQFFHEGDQNKSDRFVNSGNLWVANFYVELHLQPLNHLLPWLNENGLPLILIK